MVAIPNLPTDNLYKFVALAGLSIVVLSVVLPTAQQNATGDKIDQYTIDLAVLAVEVKNLKEELEIAVAQPRPSAHDQRLLRQRQLELDARVATITVRTAILKRLVEKQGEVLGWMAVGLLTGLVLAVIGFSLWYARVQRYQDQLLRAQGKPEQPTEAKQP